MTGHGANTTSGSAGGRPRHGRTAPRVWRAAEDGAARAVAGGAAAYDRRRSLPRLIGWDASAPAADDEASDLAIRSRLTRALRAERRRGRAGHWAYDLNRHLALLQALEGEAALALRRRAGVQRK